MAEIMAKFGNQRFQAERLTQAREYLGMTKKALAHLTGLSQQMIGSYERGASNPTDGVIDNFAQVLKAPFSFFLLPLSDERVEHVFWRSMASDTVQSQKRTTQQLQWAVEAIDLVEEFVDLVPYRLPNLQVTEWRLMSDERIEALAENVRLAWNLGRQPIEDMTLVLENAGIPVLALEIENRKQAGFMFFSRMLERPIIGTNIFEQSLARQRFSLAHELGHLLLHGAVVPSETANRSTNKQIETQAHRFASAFLFPRAAFEREVYDYSLAEFSVLKRTWGLSITAQIVRARSLGLISAEQAEILAKQSSRKGYRRPLGEPWDDVLPLEKPRLLRRAIEALADAPDGLFGDFLQDMPFSIPPMEEVFGHQLSLHMEQPNDLSSVVKLRDRAPKSQGVLKLVE
jgi:Zn-dependent peptidase ImmA (M78 family)/transcriptional regulator with XRE-family HTH domain